jgi:Fe-S cluster assembly protein SufD
VITGSVAERSLAALPLPARAGPAWLVERREAARARFGVLGLPTTKLEDWRFTSLGALGAIPFGPARLDGSATAAAMVGAASRLGAIRLVLVNGKARNDLSVRGALPPGAFVGNLATALAEIPERVRPHLGRLASFEDQAFVALNTAHMTDGVFVDLPAGAVLAEPIEILHVAEADGSPVAAHPRLLVVAGAGARATIVETFAGRGGEATLTNAVAEFVLGEGADVAHHRLQDEPERAFHLASVHVEQGAAARFTGHGLALGAALSRTEIRARLAGEGASCALSGLYMAKGTQLVDNFSVIDHAVPHCTTVENFKGILDGKSRGVFSGRIRVLPGAQKTNAQQMNSNLLLSDDAIVDTKPQLEIFADDVKCGHGGTVGQLDDTSLFYLRSRGLPEADARGLLIYAFAAEMVEIAPAGPLRERARALVAARLPTGARLAEVA